MAGTYNIGDVGPAGGIIFYDKGASSDGWQYLEAAPAQTEFQRIEWFPEKLKLSGTKAELGTGRQNTQIITEALKVFFSNENAQRSLDGKPVVKWEAFLTDKCAARRCAELDHGGVKDWFLPSADELLLMYQNLRLKGLGDFKPARYWSSSQIEDPKSSYYDKAYHLGAYFVFFEAKIVDGVITGNQTVKTSVRSNGWPVRAIRAF